MMNSSMVISRDNLRCKIEKMEQFVLLICINFHNPTWITRSEICCKESLWRNIQCIAYGDQCLLLSILVDLFTEALIVHMYLSFLNQID